MRKVMILFVTLASLSMLWAEPLTVDKAIESAKENSISLEIARIQLGQSLRNASTLSSWLPGISLTGSASTNASAINASWNPLSASVDLGISYSLGTDKIGKAEASRIEQTIAYLTYASSESTLEKSIVTSFLNLQASMLSIKQSELTLANLNNTYELTKDKYENGLISEMTLLESELSVRKAEYSLKALQDAYALSLDAFRALTGIEGDIELSSPEEPLFLDLPSYYDLYSQYSGNINSLKLKSAQIEKSENALFTTKVSNYYPSVSLSAGYGMSASGNITSSGTNNGFNDSFTAKISFSIPISSYIPGSAGDTAVKNADDNLKIAKLNLDAEEQSILQSIQSSVNTISQKEASIALAENTLQLAEKTLALKNQAYEAGYCTISELLDAQSSVASAEVALINAQTDYSNAVYQLCFTLGTTKNEIEERFGRKQEIQK